MKRELFQVRRTRPSGLSRSTELRMKPECSRRIESALHLSRIAYHSPDDPSSGGAEGFKRGLLW